MRYASGSDRITGGDEQKWAEMSRDERWTEVDQWTQQSAGDRVVTWRASTNFCAFRIVFIQVILKHGTLEAPNLSRKSLFLQESLSPWSPALESILNRFWTDYEHVTNIITTPLLRRSFLNRNQYLLFFWLFTFQFWWASIGNNGQLILIFILWLLLGINPCSCDSFWPDFHSSVETS
jgi:hypothetical protein